MQKGAERMTEYVNERQASEYLEAKGIPCKPQTLANRRSRGGGPRFVRCGVGAKGPVRYAVADLDRWIESMKRDSTRDAPARRRRAAA